MWILSIEGVVNLKKRKGVGGALILKINQTLKYFYFHGVVHHHCMQANKHVNSVSDHTIVLELKWCNDTFCCLTLPLMSSTSRVHANASVYTMYVVIRKIQFYTYSACKFDLLVDPIKVLHTIYTKREIVSPCCSVANEFLQVELLQELVILLYYCG